jgi:hypothetical protein
MNTPRTATKKSASENAYAKFMVSSLPASYRRVRGCAKIPCTPFENTNQRVDGKNLSAIRQQHSEAVGARGRYLAGGRRRYPRQYELSCDAVDTVPAVDQLARITDEYRSLIHGVDRWSILILPTRSKTRNRGGELDRSCSVDIPLADKKPSATSLMP